MRKHLIIALISNISIIVSGQNVSAKINSSQESILKSQMTVKQKLDSIVNKDWDASTNQWSDNEKSEFIYDDEGRLTKYISFNREEITGEWISSYKEEYNYVGGNLIQYNDYYHEQTTGQWINDDKEEYSYDINGNLTQYITSDWDETNNKWIVSFKGEFAYFNGDLTQYISYYHDETAGKWIASYKIEYTYDLNGNLTQYIGYDPGEAAGIWINSYKGQYSYNTEGKLAQNTSYYWDTNTSQWINHYDTEFTYDAKGNLTQTLEYYWDGYARRWINNEKQEYTYDSANNMIRYCEFYRNQTGAKWIPTYKEEYTYNNDYDYSDLIIPNLYEDNNEIAFNHMRLSNNNFKWDENLSKWIDYTQGIYYYSNYYTEEDFPVAVDDDFSIEEDSLLTNTVGSNDTASKNEPNTWELLYGYEPRHGNILSWDAANGDFTYQPDQDYHGEDWFYYILRDGNGDCDTARVDIIIISVNDAPFVIDTIPNYMINSGQSVAIHISPEPGKLFDDVDVDDILTITIFLEDGTPLPDFMTYYNDTLFASPLPADTGCYYILVKATDLEGAFASISFELCVDANITTVRENIKDDFNITIYPNPVSEFLFFLFPDNCEQVDFELFDMKGKKLLYKTIKNGEKSDMQELPNGVYIYNLITNEKILCGKLIKR